MSLQITPKMIFRFAIVVWIFSLGAIAINGALWAQDVRYCEGYYETKSQPRVSEFCAQGEYSNACYEKWRSAVAAVDEYNAKVQACKSQTNSSQRSPSQTQQRQPGRPDPANNQTSPQRDGVARSNTGQPGSSVSERLRARQNATATETPRTQQRLDELKQQHRQAISDGKAAWDQRQQQLADERRQLDEEMAQMRVQQQRFEQPRIVCYGDSNSIHEGFRQCVSECRSYYDERSCRRSCNNDGESDGGGQSCYPRPN